jgi:hypothetical protein
MRTRALLVVPTALLMSGVVYSIWFWGNPVPLQTRLLERLDTRQNGRIDIWRYDTSNSGKASVTEIDSDHDGMVDRLQLGNPVIKELDLGRVAAGTSERKWLAVCLDGVPYDVMAKLWDEGLFREFSRPVKMISVFPSVSDVALTEVLHAERVPGYENLYFDLERNRTAGGALSTVSKARIPYLEILDYDEPGIFKGIAYILPVKTYRADLGRFLKRYQASNLRRYQAHLCSTDSLCHVMTPADFRQLLHEVDTLLREIFLRREGALDLVVFSDHGNSQVLSTRVDVERFLAERGFRVESSVQSEKSVVIPGFGLVGVMALYCRPESTAKLAQVLSRCEGVDFCAFLDRGVAQIISREGAGHILANSSEQSLKYETIGGDPLHLASIQQQLVHGGQVDSQGFVRSDDWFNATAEHEFPDAVNAIYRGLTNHVTNRASLLVSLKDGYHYGSKFFDRLVTLRSTHGSLRRTSMTGFFMRNAAIGQTSLAARNVLSGPGR